MGNYKNMKIEFISIFAVLFVVGIQANGSGCDIKFFEKDPDNWGNFSAGYLLGVHAGNETRIETCEECMTFGTNLRNINEGPAYILNNKEKWIRQTRFANMDIGQTI